MKKLQGQREGKKKGKRERETGERKEKRMNYLYIIYVSNSSPGNSKC